MRCPGGNRKGDPWMTSRPRTAQLAAPVRPYSTPPAPPFSRGPLRCLDARHRHVGGRDHRCHLRMLAVTDPRCGLFVATVMCVRTTCATGRWTPCSPASPWSSRTSTSSMTPSRATSSSVDPRHAQGGDLPRLRGHARAHHRLGARPGIARARPLWSLCAQAREGNLDLLAPTGRMPYNDSPCVSLRAAHGTTAPLETR